RTFLQTISAGIPTLRLMSRADNSCELGASDPAKMFASAKFTPLPLDRYFNASSKQFGPRERARQSLQASSEDGLIRTPSGQCRFRGIPFLLGADGVEKKSFLVVSNQQGGFSAPVVEIPLH